MEAWYDGLENDSIVKSTIVDTESSAEYQAAAFASPLYPVAPSSQTGQHSGDRPGQ